MELNVLPAIIRTHPEKLLPFLQVLSNDQIGPAVDILKAEADRNWFINANRSLELADIIVALGRARDMPAHCALGMMARGDALQYLGHFRAAWTALDEAGGLYQSIGDDFGWARTRIGRLLLSVDMQCVPEAVADAERARQIFERHGNQYKQVTLDLNLGVVYYSLGNQTQALMHYQRALAAAEALHDAGAPQTSLGSDIALLYNNIGITYDLLGDFRQALASHERAHERFIQRGELVGAALVETNMAHISMAQGNFRSALQLLHQARDHYRAEGHELDASHASRDMLECFLALNRFADARDLALQVIASYQQAGSPYYEGLALLHAATADAELARFDEAGAALDRASAIFSSIDATALVGITRLRRGQIALNTGAPELAQSEALAAAQACHADGQQLDYARALLLLGQAQFALHERAGARTTGEHVLRIAQTQNLPTLRYAAHLLLGQVAEAEGRLARAARRYTAAIATVSRVQMGLTITLRTGFMEDKGEALRTLIGLYLRQGRTARAFETLERAKSQVLLGYLADRSHLRWRTSDAHSHALVEELEQLRAEHHWFYRLAHDRAPNEDGQVSSVSKEQALAEVTARERRMREISERLYLASGDGDVAATLMAPSLAAIQHTLDQQTLLLEFYSDRDALWVFAIDQHTAEVYQLPIKLDTLDQLISKLERNLSMALGIGPHGPGVAQLAGMARTLLARLYNGLLAPVAARLGGRQRLVIAPYGSLHYLPFHLLYNGFNFLIERHEVVTVPAAGLLTRSSPARSGGARVIAHSWNGRLPQTHIEAACVQNILGGQVFAETHARRAALELPPSNVLHIAAHGEQRIEQPDLSYIQLDDVQLYTDDLLQHDMSYELVVLSACETGRARVAAGDELIGLGRGFLYAGAGALITTLWRVDDALTLRVMERLYQALRAGQSKASALREAQLAILASDAQLHPAFWGAFQLVGDARPLSGGGSTSRIEEVPNAGPELVC